MIEYDIPLSPPELWTIQRVPESLSARIRMFGPDISLDNLGSYEPRSQDCLYMPHETLQQVCIRSYGPCRRCQSFLRKLVHLVRADKSHISGVLELTDHGHRIHDIQSDKTKGYLGAAYPVLRDTLAEDDDIHDTHTEWLRPCPLYSSCKELLCWDFETQTVLSDSHHQKISLQEPDISV